MKLKWANVLRLVAVKDVLQHKLQTHNGCISNPTIKCVTTIQPRCNKSCLHQTGSRPVSFIARKEAFYARREQEGEMLRGSSHALFSLMDKMIQSCPERRIPDAARMLPDQLAEGGDGHFHLLPVLNHHA